MVPKLSDLELGLCTLVVSPERPNSEIVRSEKKYERHSFGKVLKPCPFYEMYGGEISAGIEEMIGEAFKRISAGDYVFYDDANSIPGVVEVDGVKISVEFLNLEAVVACAKTEGEKNGKTNL